VDVRTIVNFVMAVTASGARNMLTLLSQIRGFRNGQRN
jgi:hypothetical protein